MAKTTEQFKTVASKKHNDFYDYSLWSQNVKSKEKVSIICPTHGRFEQLLNSHLQGSGCKKCAQIKKEALWLAKYGVTNPAKNKKCINKAIQTNLERYGVDHPAKLQHTKDKVKQTKKDKYGDENYNNATKNQQTKLIKYGNKFYNNRSEECTKSIKQTKLNRYGNENYNNSNATRQTNEGKFGIKHASQRDMLKVVPMLISKQWMVTEHLIKKKALTEIAEQLDVSITTVSNYMKHHQITVIRYRQSIAEKEINQFINSLNINTNTSVRNIISPLELDIHIPSHNIAIEYCGLYWHSDQHDRIDNQYHKRKHDLCNKQNIQLITIFEDEWRDRQQQVKLKLASLLGIDSRETIYARKCTIQLVNYKTKRDFFDEHHIQGNGPGSIHIGLSYNNTIVAIMSFIKQKEIHYLNRYATSNKIPGGFSKLLKYFQTNYKWNQIVSFADRRWSNGNLYTKTGWELDEIIAPDYSYSSDGKNRIHKFNYRRRNLNKLLECFNPNLSERENCDNNGVLRIWDCGKLRFILNHTSLS